MTSVKGLQNPFRVLLGTALCLGGVTLSSVVQAQTDVTFGGDARAYAMGGAGIALAQDIGGGRVNPASLAFETKKSDVRIPTVSMRTSNDLSLNKVQSYFLSGQLKSVADTTDIVRSFVKRDSDFGINADTAIRLQNVEVSGFAVAKGRLLPNQALRTWVENGKVGSVPSDARADVIAAGYVNLPTVSAGFLLPQSKKGGAKTAIGVRAKIMRAYYAHYVANADVLNGKSEVIPATELGPNDYLNKTGFGADLGFLIKPKSTRHGGFSYGGIIANAINPNLKFNGTDRNDNQVAYNLVKTTASVGTAYQYGGLTLVADLVDITGATGHAQFRSGSEFMLPLVKIALRAGYSSASGFTYGVGAFGFNVALGKKQPLEVVKTLNF